MIETIEGNICKACLGQAPERVYGKPNKNRASDPTMFQLLSWGWANDNLDRIHLPVPNGVIHLASGDCIYRKHNEENTVDSQGAQNLSRKSLKKDDKLDQNEVKFDKQEVKAASALEKTAPKSSAIKRISKHQPPPKAEAERHYVPPEKDKVVQVPEKEQKELIEKFKQTTRWIPNSAFMTYFGKPPFAAYGSGNTHSKSGGLIYGDYMHTHNVFPHCGRNRPRKEQCYANVLLRARSCDELLPRPSRTIPNRPEAIANSDSVEASFPIFARDTRHDSLPISTPILNKIPRFSKGKVRVYSAAANHGQERVHT